MAYCLHHINESLACKNDDLPVSGFIGIEMQSDLWVVLNVRDFISPCLTEDQERIILPEEPDRSWLRRESRIDSGQPDHILILKMLLYGTAKIRLKVDHLQAAGFIRSATSSATSFTCTVPPSAREASLSIVMQNGQPTASVFALVSFTSLKRASLTRSVPGSSSFHICAPPAPQQKDLDSLRGISIVVTPADFNAWRGASRIPLCRPR